MTFKKLVPFLALLIPLLLAGCAGSSAQAAPDDSLGEVETATDLPQSLVMLDIFSGRPNPEWNLSPEQTIALIGLLEDLPPCVTPTERFEGLGYRGFLVDVVAPESLQTSKLFAGNGAVELGEGEALACYRDGERTVEKWLLESGRGAVEDELYQSLLEEFKQ